MAGFKERWNIQSNWQLFIIIVVFAVTGSTAAYCSKPILALLGIIKYEVSHWLYYPLYIILIFPVYQVLLVSFGFLFGQFQFFWAFEKRFFKRIAGWFKRQFLEFICLASYRYSLLYYIILGTRLIFLFLYNENSAKIVNLRELTS